MDFLSSFGAERIDMRPITDSSGRGKNKIRVMFEINEQEKAQALYEMIGVQRKNHLPETDQKMQIYFLKDEKKFEEYADLAAEKYYKDMAKAKAEQEAYRKAERERREQ